MGLGEMQWERVFLVAGDSTGKLKEIKLGDDLEYSISPPINTNFQEPIEKIKIINSSLYLAVSCNGSLAVVQPTYKLTFLWKPTVRRGKLTGFEVVKGSTDDSLFLLLTFSEDPFITVLLLQNYCSSQPTCEQHSRFNPYQGNEQIEEEDPSSGLVFLAQLTEKGEFCCAAVGQEMIAFSWNYSNGEFELLLKSSNIPEIVTTGVLKDPGYLGACLQDSTLWTVCKNGQIRAFAWNKEECFEPLVATKPVVAKPFPLIFIGKGSQLPSSTLVIGDSRGNCYEFSQLTKFISNPKVPQFKKFKTSTCGAPIAIHPLWTERCHSFVVIGTMDGYLLMMENCEERKKIPLPCLTALSQPMTLASNSDPLWNSLSER